MSDRAPEPHPQRWLILFVILSAECMDLLDGTIVNVAVPTIHRDLHASSTALQWIVGGYSLALAVGLLIGGRLGDVFGRRRLFLVGVCGFTIASAISGLAPTTAILIASRLAQGLAGAMMIPQGFGLLRQVFRREELSKAFGLFGPVMGSAAMIGPILGGGLVSLQLTAGAWRPVFLVNLPIGIAAAAAAARLLPRVQERHAQRLDVPGAVLAAVASMALIYPLIQGRELGWPAWTCGSIAASLALFAVLGARMLLLKRSGADPLLEPSIFGHRGYSAGALVLMLYFGGMVGSLLAVTLYLQLGEAFSPIHAGLTIAPFALGTALAAPLAGAMMSRVPGRALIQAGVAVSLAGYAAVALVLGSDPHVSTWTLCGPLLAVGLGMGLFVVPSFDTIIAAVTDSELGSASGVLNAVQQLGGAIGVAVLGTVFFTVLPHQGFTAALRHAMWWQVGGLAIVLALSPLLPARARATAPDGALPAAA